ncbi:MAG: MBL fold metallo-hydrolase [Kiritimatiellaeota bacterium]|nr:MBL fold metallo-hydrolase [Kiritimatiellota bacterium]
MRPRIKWFGHASFLIDTGTVAVAVDPWKVPADAGPVSLILVSHSHFDHYSAEDVRALSNPETVVCGPPDVPGAVCLPPGATRLFDTITITGVAAYNIGKNFHPRANHWLGFVLELGGKRVYYAGDTDRVPEMRQLEAIDVALLPVGGTYTMDAGEAACAAGEIGCRLSVPCHWGDIVGARGDAERFRELCRTEVRVLEPGEALDI